MLNHSLEHLARYNIWANEKMAGFVCEAGEDKADLVQASSFPSIRKTLYHIWDAEYIWIKRLNGESLTKGASADFRGTLREACDLMLKNSELFVFYLEQKSEENLNKVIDYTNIAGNKYCNTVSQIITHVMNHSTYHRGQLITLLRNAGYTTVSTTDYIAFCRI